MDLNNNKDTYYYGECRKLIDTFKSNIIEATGDTEDRDYNEEANVIYSEDGFIDGYIAMQYRTESKEKYEKVIETLNKTEEQIREEVEHEGLFLSYGTNKKKINKDLTVYFAAVAVEIQPRAYNRLHGEKVREEDRASKEFGFR